MKNLWQRRWIRVLTLMAGLGVLCGLVVFYLVVSDIASASDADQAHDVMNDLLERYHNPALRFDHATNTGTYYVRPGGRFQTLILYGITEHSEQDKILEIVGHIRSERNTKPIVVKFVRDREEILRKVKVR